MRPRFRGSLHRISAPVGAIAFVVLAAIAPTAGQRVAIAVYGVCVTLMLSVSGTYHSARISPELKRKLKRVDHSTILLAIAGSYTAVTTFALTGTARVVMLTAGWVLALLGIAIRNLWLDAPNPVTAVVYLVVGWFVVVDLPGYVDGLSGGQLGLIVAGGLLYTVGALVYALKKPNPWPATFGYHEVFHTFVVAGVVAHYLAVFSLARAA
jgi:hemolysin III